MTAKLRELQSWFQAAMTSPAGEPIDASSAAAHVTPGPQLDSGRRMEVYHSAYWARLVEVLADDYPTLKHAMGEDAFDALCHAYIAAHPSTGPNLNPFGRHMSSFLRGRDLGDEVPSAFASGLAALEWAIVEVLHAPPTPPLAADVLTRIPQDAWAEVRFEPGSAFRIVEAEYPVNAYFQALKNESPISIPDPAWSCTAVYRDGYTIWRWDMSRAMTTLLKGLVAGATLGDALGALQEDEAMLKDALANLGGWFQEWVSRGFFAKVVESP